MDKTILSSHNFEFFIITNCDFVRSPSISISLDGFDGAPFQTGLAHGECSQSLFITYLPPVLIKTKAFERVDTFIDSFSKLENNAK